jgi:hypothetical protein
MGLLFWKDNAKIDAFGAALAEHLFSHVQPDMARQHFSGASKGENKKKQYKVQQQFNALVGQMREFCETQSLGVYGKARLQKSFSDRLLELGYDDQVTTRLVETIVFRNL